MEKRRFNTENSTLEFVINSKPTLAGIVAYNKRIDRNAVENLVALEEKK